MSHMPCDVPNPGLPEAIMPLPAHCRETEPNWPEEIAGDVKEECGKYGMVSHLHVDKDSKVLSCQSLGLHDHLFRMPGRSVTNAGNLKLACLQSGGLMPSQHA